METNEEIISELKRLNKNLDKINHPGKHILSNFVGGAAHTLGAIFGTLIIVSAIFFVLSKINLSEPISNWIEDTLNKVRWDKITAPPIQQQIQQIQTIESQTINPN